MPYKDPERKRQWELEHRVQRNARRRRQHLAVSIGRPSVPKPAPDPVRAQKPQSNWNTILGGAVGIGFVLLSALPGLASGRPDMPSSDSAA
jgi:hypothetical protein